MTQSIPPAVNEIPAEVVRETPSVRPRARFSPQDRARRKNHGLIGHLSTLVLQPRLFFYTFPETRHWLFVALVSLFIVGYVAVQESGSASSPGAAETPIDSFGPPVFDMGGGDPFGVPLPVDGGGGGGGGVVATSDTTSQVTTAVKASAMLAAVWVVQALLLMLVTLFNGRSPSFGKGLQIAVWASVPLVMMLIVQLVYHNAGGTGGSPGVSALLNRWDEYRVQPADVQWLMMSALSQVTLWRVWSLALLYFGARDALRGRWIVSVAVVALWAGVAIVAPVMLGMTPLPADPSAEMPSNELPVPEMEMPPLDFGMEGDMPPLNMDRGG